MNACALLVLVVVTILRIGAEGMKNSPAFFLDVNFHTNYEQRSYIVIIGSKITPENMVYFNIGEFEEQKESFMRDCFGTAISNNWVLTAAYCAKGSPENKRVILDENIVSTKTTSYRHVLKNMIYDDYLISKENPFDNDNVQITVNNDIGMLMVEALELQQYGKLSRIKYKHFMGKHVSYIRFQNPGPVGSKNQKTTGEIIEHGTAAKCDEDDDVFAFKYKWYFKLQPAMCVVSESNRGQKVQRGVSGGPLLSDGKIIGVATGTHPLQFHYTPVSPFLDWIYTTLSYVDTYEGAK